MPDQIQLIINYDVLTSYTVDFVDFTFCAIYNPNRELNIYLGILDLRTLDSTESFLPLVL